MNTNFSYDLHWIFEKRHIYQNCTWLHYSCIIEWLKRSSYCVFTEVGMLPDAILSLVHSWYEVGKIFDCLLCRRDKHRRKNRMQNFKHIKQLITNGSLKLPYILLAFLYFAQRVSTKNFKAPTCCVLDNFNHSFYVG